MSQGINIYSKPESKLSLMFFVFEWKWELSNLWKKTTEANFNFFCAISGMGTFNFL